MTLRIYALAAGALSWLVLAALCLFFWGKWDHAVMQGRIDVEDAKKVAAEAKAADVGKQAAATDTFAQRTTALQPIIIGSNMKADAYAQTPAGRAPCLAADRVQSILADRNALFAATAAQSGAGSVPAGGDPAGGPGQR